MLKKSENIPFYAKGLRFSCERCSRCCRYESGYVFLSIEDASRMAGALNMDYEDFRLAFCRWVSVGNGMARLSLKEKSNYDCILWSANKEGGCSVYNERPLQCRTFPFWPSIMGSKEYWEDTAANCPGIGKGSLYSYDSINERLSLSETELIISKRV